MLSEEEKAHDLVARLYRSAFNLDASTREDAVRHAGMFRQAASELERLTRERDELQSQDRAAYGFERDAVFAHIDALVTRAEAAKAEAARWRRAYLDAAKDAAELAAQLNAAAKVLEPFANFATWADHDLSVADRAPDDRVVVRLAPGCPSQTLGHYRAAAALHAQITGGEDA